MLLRRIGLSNFRNYADLDLEPAPGLNVFVGANAQGKSNLLEGIAMLGTGKSFRTTREADTIRAGFERAVLAGHASSRAGSVNLGCTVEKGNRGTRKSYTVNANGVRYANYLGKIRVVTFVPADLDLAAGTPSLRRAFLNAALSQTQPRYYHELARYRRALQQKNALLRTDAAAQRDLLAVYDGVLLEAGTELMLAREQLVRALAPSAARAHARFSGHETFDVHYEPDVRFEAATPQAIIAAFEIRMREVEEAERVRKTAVAGPHRDDVRLTLDGAPLGAFGSQGQQRTAVLALKVAEYSIMRERSGEAPLLLLDDVLSELDENRATAFLAEIGHYEQGFVTATHLPSALPLDAHVARVSNAEIGTLARC